MKTKLPQKNNFFIENKNPLKKHLRKSLSINNEEESWVFYF